MIAIAAVRERAIAQDEGGFGRHNNFVAAAKNGPHPELVEDARAVLQLIVDDARVPFGASPVTSPTGREYAADRASADLLRGEHREPR